MFRDEIQMYILQTYKNEKQNIILHNFFFFKFRDEKKLVKFKGQNSI